MGYPIFDQDGLGQSQVHTIYVHVGFSQNRGTGNGSSVHRTGGLPLSLKGRILSAPLSKNTISAFQISSKLLSFTLKDSLRN